MELKIVSLISDLGAGSFLLGSLKARILSATRQLTFLDIEHNIQPYDCNEAAFILLQSLRHLPEQSLCMVLVDASVRKHGRLLLAENDSRKFICADNGILSILGPGTVFSEIPEDVRGKGSVKDQFASACIYLLSGETYQWKVLSSEEAGTKSFQKPLIGKEQMTGSVVYTDRYGNVYTNINDSDLAQFLQGKKMRIHLSRHETLEGLHTDYDEVPEGEIAAFLDDNGYLQIAVNEGNASGLLGLQKGSKIIVEKR